jgi:HEAT repeat protein
MALVSRLGERGTAAGAAVPDLATRLVEPHPLVRLAALEALGRLGPVALPALSALSARLADRAASAEERTAAADALGRLGERAVPPLAAGLGDRVIGDVALDALAAIGAPAIPALIAALDQDIPDADRALGQIGAPAVPAILAACARTPRLRPALFRALARMGPAAAPAVPLLTETLRAGESLAPAAARTLGALGPAAAPVLAAELLHPRRADLCDAALDGLTAIGPAALPAWDPLLDDPRPEIRLLALRGLGDVGRQLTGRLADEEQPGALAGRALRDALRPLVAALVARTRDARPEVRLAALERLAMLHEHGRPARAAIERAMLDPDRFTRRKAVYALGEVFCGDPVGASAVHRMLRDPDTDVRATSVWALKRMRAPALVPWLLAALADEDAAVRHDAASFLGDCGRAARPALPSLQRALGDANDQVRRAASTAIEAITRGR